MVVLVAAGSNYGFAVGAKPTANPWNNNNTRCCFATYYSAQHHHNAKARRRRRKTTILSALERPSASTPSPSPKEEEEYGIVTALKTTYNEIVIVDTPNSTMLLLDSTHNVHSIFNKDGMKWTGSYWDEFATLPPIVPQAPIAILGLGGGTCAHLMLELWPSLKLHGWEIDGVLIDKSRQYLGLSDLEKCTQTGGLLSVHVGDALSESVSVPGGFAGIVVDLFSDGKVLPQLKEVTTWLKLNDKLATHGRIMVNCAGADATIEYKDRKNNGSSDDDLWLQNSTIKALCNAFPGKVSWKKVGGDGENYLALTGPFPDLNEWSAVVPENLSLNVKQWRPCHISA